MISTDNNKYALARIARATVLAGLIGSLGLTLYAGLNTPAFLLALFVLWVPSPFLGFLMAHVIAKSWSVLTRRILYYVMIIITPASLVGLSGAWIPQGVRPAFMFLVIPLVGWLIVGLIILAGLRSRGS